MLVVFQTRKEDFIEDVFVMHNQIRNLAKKGVLMILIVKDMSSIVQSLLARAIWLQILSVRQIAEGLSMLTMSEH